MKTKLLGLIACVALLGGMAATRADTLTPFTLSATFSDGGSASGTFTLDSTTNTLLDLSVTTTAGSVLVGFSYSTTATPLLYCGTVCQYYFYTYSQGQASVLVIDLVNYPSLINPTLVADGGSFEQLMQPTGSLYRYTASGEIVPVSTTPLPAALPLFASGLGALGLLGWRRKRKAQAAA
jgi:hypothetical protein